MISGFVIKNNFNAVSSFYYSSAGELHDEKNVLILVTPWAVTKLHLYGSRFDGCSDADYFRNDKDLWILRSKGGCSLAIFYLSLKRRERGSVS